MKSSTDICSEGAVMYHALLMAQESCDPESYEHFIRGYNTIIESRHLINVPIPESQDFEK
jgi:hypothetical protein